MGRYKVEREEKPLPGDFHFLNTLDLLKKLKEITDREGGLRSFATIASSVSTALKAISDGGLRLRIEALIEEEKTSLIVGIEDYGKWRSSRDNAGYGDYVMAREGKSPSLRRMQNALEDFNWLENIINPILKRFSSLDELITISIALNRLVAELRSEPAELMTLMSSTIDTRDTSLCIKWSNAEVQAGPETRKLSEQVKSSEACRLLSARAAEKAVVLYYRSLGEEVKDISITQLDDCCEQWKEFDILVGVRPIDVKNARRSFSSPNTYVEHCVPKFKIERKYGADISIAGALSDYGDEDEILSGQVSCRILGETNVSGIRKLYSWMRTRFEGTLDLDGLWRQGYLPGWMFEYPDAQYAHRKTAIGRLGDVFAECGKVCRSKEDIPGWLLTLCPNRDMVASLSVSKTKRNILSDLHLLHDQIGFSRPSLFVYVMGIMLESMLEGASSDETAATLKDLIFFDRDSTYPLFLLDTQEYVANLIELLSRVREEAVRKKVRFVGFSMPHPSILLGKRDGLSTMTLIAYCGGWREVPAKIKCGESPLYFGKHDICPSCSHLICGKCGHCWYSCPLVTKRQADVARA